MDRKTKYFGFVEIYVHEVHFDVEASSLESAKEKLIDMAKRKFEAKLKKAGCDDPHFKFKSIHVRD